MISGKPVVIIRQLSVTMSHTVMGNDKRVMINAESMVRPPGPGRRPVLKLTFETPAKSQPLVLLFEILISYAYRSSGSHLVQRGIVYKFSMSYVGNDNRNFDRLWIGQRVGRYKRSF